MVTEYISTGQSIAALISALEEVGIDFDVAAVSMDSSPGSDLYGRTYKTMFKKHLYYGIVSSTILGFYNQPYLSGVRKSEEVDSAHPLKFRPQDKKQEEDLRVNMGTSREDMAMLADELSKLLE